MVAHTSAAIHTATQLTSSPCLWQALALVGEFNNWDPKDNHWAHKNDFGVWQLFLPDSDDGQSAIPHRCDVLGSFKLFALGRQALL